MNSPIETIGQELIDATSEMFDDHCVPLAESVRCEPVADWLDPIAVIGFGGDALRGSVSFEVPWRVLQASHPTKSAETEDLVDWVGEMANLVLGRLKTKLRALGIGIQLGLPSTFTTSAKQTGATGSAQLQYRLRAADGCVLVRFSAELERGFQMVPPRRVETVQEFELF